MEIFIFLIVVLVVPILVNKTTERGRFDFVHPYLRHAWTGLLILFTYYVLDKPGVKEIVMRLFSRFGTSQPVWSYLTAFCIGGLLLCWYWYATGWLLKESGGQKPPENNNPIAQSPSLTPIPSPSEHTTATKQVTQRSKGSNSPNVNQEQKTTGANSPAIQQQGRSNIAQIGNNNQATINEAPPERQWAPSYAQLAELKRNPARVRIYSVSDAEAMKFANKIATILSNNGWEIAEMGISTYVPEMPRGVWIMSRTDSDPAAVSLISALRPFEVGRKIVPEMTPEWGRVITVGLNEPLGKSLPAATMVSASQPLPRSLTKDQAIMLPKRLEKYRGQSVTVNYPIGNDEAIAYAQQFVAVLQAAGWNAGLGLPQQFTEPCEGLRVGVVKLNSEQKEANVPEAAEALSQVLESVGLKVARSTMANIYGDTGLFYLVVCKQPH
jgi:hypothetical protein